MKVRHELKSRFISQPVFFTDLYATTHFNSDPALLVNVEQQLSTSLGDLTPAHGSFPNNSALGDTLRTLLLPTGTSENRESLTKRSLSPSRRGFKRKDNILATLNPKHGFRDATGSEASVGLFVLVQETPQMQDQNGVELRVVVVLTKSARNSKNFQRPVVNAASPKPVILLPLGKSFPFCHISSFLSQGESTSRA